jgi:hypothetical protein
MTKHLENFLIYKLRFIRNKLACLKMTNLFRPSLIFKETYLTTKMLHLVSQEPERIMLE